MNILRLVYEWPPVWGGLTAGPYEISATQADHGHSVRHLCGGWPRHAVYPASGVRVRRLPSALPKFSLFPTTAPAALAFTLAWHRWTDLIHGHQHLPVWYHLARRMGMRQRPYVLHLHITAAGRSQKARHHGEKIDVWTDKFEWPLHEKSDRWGCQTADAIICVSDSVKQEAIDHYDADPAQLHVVSNGVNTDRFTPHGRDRRADFGFQPDDKVILFVGSLQERKRPGLLLHALAHLPRRYKALIIGQGPLEANLHALVDELNLADRVRITGFVPYPDLPPLYRTADIFALLARYEGFPKVVLEALAAGLPVVTTPSFGVDDAIRPFIHLLDDDTPDAIAAALATAHTIEVDQTVMQTQYSWHTKVKQMQAIYEQIL